VRGRVKIKHPPPSEVKVFEWILNAAPYILLVLIGLVMTWADWTAVKEMETRKRRDLN
jgi:hypothetical protein